MGRGGENLKHSIGELSCAGGPGSLTNYDAVRHKNTYYSNSNQQQNSYGTWNHRNGVPCGKNKLWWVDVDFCKKIEHDAHHENECDRQPLKKPPAHAKSQFGTTFFARPTRPCPRLDPAPLPWHRRIASGTL